MLTDLKAACYGSLERACEAGHFRLGFDRRVRLDFHGSKISSDGGLSLFLELDKVLGLHDSAGGFLRDTRTGHNRLHSLVGVLRQTVFGRLAGDNDANDRVTPQVVGGRQTTYLRALPGQTRPCVDPEGCTLGRPNQTFMRGAAF